MLLYIFDVGIMAYYFKVPKHSYEQVLTGLPAYYKTTIDNLLYIYKLNE